MLEVADIQKLSEVLATKQDLDGINEKLDLHTELLDKMITAVDGLAKRFS